MEKIVECVPNFSTSDPGIIKQITNAIKQVANTRLLNVEPDADYNRVVVTFVTTPKSAVEAAFAGIAKATELIDMQSHKGEHPRMGATDVTPFIPVKGISDEECITIAKNLAKKIADELNVPTYLYGKAASNDERIKLSNIRKGQYEGLAEKIIQPEWKPDYGNPGFNSKSGAYVIGVRDFLIAYNINLKAEEVSIAKEVAELIRETGRLVEKDGEKVRVPGMLKGVQGMGFPLEREGRKLTQVSMNVVDFKNQSKPHEAFEAAKKLAEERGTTVTGSEIVGLVPLEAILDAGKFYLPNETNQDKLITIAIEKLGLSDLDDFNPKRKIIELMIQEEFLFDLPISEFIEELASSKPAPGGGSVAALGGALAASLTTMVANLSVGKEKYADVEDTMMEIIAKSITMTKQFGNAIDDDSDAFNQVMNAFRIPKENPSRPTAIQGAFVKAAEVPLNVASMAYNLFDLIHTVADKGNKNTITDAGVAALFAEATVRGALFNVQINLISIKDEELKSSISKKINSILSDVSVKRDRILEIVNQEIS
jgi:glutamate formiminotransferase/formiminotetrahydrofolate cyclodeaminase